MKAPALAALAREDAARALAEDVGAGDLTAGLVDSARRAQARVLARESAVICGAPWVQAALLQVDASLQIKWLVDEGQRLVHGREGHLLALGRRGHLHQGRLGSQGDRVSRSRPDVHG